MSLPNGATQTFHLDAFGLEVESDFAFPGASAEPGPGRPHRLHISRADLTTLPAATDTRRYLRNLQSYEGAPYAMLESEAGDVLFLYGRIATFHLSADRTELRCAVARPGDATWQRVLLDTVLWTVSLLCGYELLHASAVATDHGVIALIAASGGGKSSLAAELLRRGGRLFADDVIALGEEGLEMTAYPGPPLMNLPEVITPGTVGEAALVYDFGDERWIHLAGPRPPAGPLAAAIILDRRPGETTNCSPVEATTLTILGHMLSLPHLGAMRRRFELLGAFAETVPVWSLRADISVTPGQLADHIESRGAAA